ncbi:MAG TPA: hypothetical protein VF228_03225 [Iamia sp.]
MTPTDTPAPDEIALPAFEEALWSALRAEHARAGESTANASTSTADDVEVLDPAPNAAPMVRRRARRALAVAAAVAVLGASAVLAARAGGGDDDGTTVVRPVATDPTTTLAPEAQLAADLRELMLTTVVATESRVQGRLVRRGWADDVSGTRHGIEYGPDGETPEFELGLAEAPDPDGGFVANPLLRAVDHCSGQWSESAGPNMSSELRGLADQLDRGSAVIDGTDVVDGREMLVVRPVSSRFEIDPETGEPIEPPTPDTTILPYNAVYVDAETSHPVVLEPGPVSNPEMFPAITYQLRPRDGAALELLVAAAPAGYARVDAVPTDEERAAVC